MIIPTLQEYLIENKWEIISNSLIVNKEEDVVIKIEGDELHYIDSKVSDGPLKYESNFDTKNYIRAVPLVIMIHHLKLIDDIEKYKVAINLIDRIQSKGDILYYTSHVRNDETFFHDINIFRTENDERIVCASYGISTYVRLGEANEHHHLCFGEFPLKIFLTELWCILNPEYYWNDIKDAFEITD